MPSAVVFATVARGPIAQLIEKDHDPRGPVPTWRHYYRARPTGLPPRDKLLKLGLWLECQRQRVGHLLFYFQPAGLHLQQPRYLLHRPAGLALAGAAGRAVFVLGAKCPVASKPAASSGSRLF